MARAMVLLVNEWEFTRGLARNARRTAEALSWERELDRLDASYREVCDGGMAPGSGRGVGKDAGDRRAAAPLTLGVHPAAVRLGEVLHDREA
jgi:anti-sigma factor RsiW